MIVTTEEAKKTVCCNAGAGCCISIECTAWRWADAEHTRGYCGLAGRPDATEEKKAETTWAVTPEWIKMKADECVALRCKKDLEREFNAELVELRRGSFAWAMLQLQKNKRVIRRCEHCGKMSFRKNSMPNITIEDVDATDWEIME